MLKKKMTSCCDKETQVFWSEIAPSDHLLQIYHNDKDYLDALVRFTGDGFKSGESVVVIATAWHLNALEKRLDDFDTDGLRARDQYIPLDAEETLSKFMVDGWADSRLFEECVTTILKRAGKKGQGRRVRAFGEMVALLWAKGHDGATLHLENLWHQLQKKQAFSLFCAYPKNGFTEEQSDGVEKICQAHSKIVPFSYAV